MELILIFDDSTSLPGIHPFCFVVIGNQLTYPVINGAGYLPKSTSTDAINTYIKCTQSNFNSSSNTKIICGKIFSIREIFLKRI